MGIDVLAKSKLSIAIASLLTLNSFNAVGQESNAANNDAAESEVITIVGHKITELHEQNNSGALGSRSVLDTPFSVDMISLEDIEIRQVNTLDSLFSREASVSVDGSAYSTFGSTIRVRGLPLDYTNSFKVNGLSLNNFSGELPYEAFEQVALLKGATGYMYGMAAPGGVVNYVTKKPVNDLLTLSAGYRSDGVFSAHVDASTRFGDEDKFGLRVNAVSEQGDTYLDDGTIDRESFSLAFDAYLSDSLHWNVDVIYSDRLTENSWTTMSNSMSSDSDLPAAVQGNRSIGVDGTFDDYNNLIALTGLTWEINDNWQVKLEYDYSENDTHWVKTLAYLLNSQGDVSISLYEQYFKVNYEQTQAIINGQFETGSISHELVFGASYQVSDTYRNDGGEYGRVVVSNYGEDNLYNPVELPAYDANLQEDLDLAWSDTQQSFFINDSIKFNEQFELLIGVRHTNIDHTAGEYFSAFHDHYADSSTTPLAALMYKPNETTTFYTSYVESFEGQTSSVGDSYANANELLKPQKSEQLEVGYKQSGDDWSASAAIFSIKRGSTLVTDDNYLVQDGVSVYQGVELSGALDISNNFSIYSELMVLDATYDKTNESYQGNQVSGTPDYQVSLQTNYNIEAVEGLTVNFGGKHQGETAANANNDWNLPSHTVFYAGVSLSKNIAGKNLTIIGTVDNLFDKEFWAVGDDYGALRIGEPRVVAIKAKLAF
ncbi:TonB-dependent siderophore receptor [Pseudoalteromonas sp. MMG010]|uniref:TonB-dependent siderophore receptor n=1 Tax=Pseudoalteromonas sp. MMG010 TaxID=2822685 RepID=UPI001B39F0C1|nr:TonB-dependent siderophore receptor [Pseudoalteromonas sp. MMG010]MBQ4833157.1 TonB-dependent siderophore receptor [Pseudoalteromonas sp. MMG010]